MPGFVELGWLGDLSSTQAYSDGSPLPSRKAWNFDAGFTLTDDPVSGWLTFTLGPSIQIDGTITADVIQAPGILVNFPTGESTYSGTITFDSATITFAGCTITVDGTSTINYSDGAQVTYEDGSSLTINDGATLSVSGAYSQSLGTFLIGASVLPEFQGGAHFSGTGFTVDFDSNVNIDGTFTVTGGATFTGGVDASALNVTNGGAGITGKLDVRQNANLSGDISPSAITGTQTDWAPTGIATASIIRVALSGSATIDSIDPGSGADGRILILHNLAANSSGFTITLVHASGSGTATMRLACSGDANKTINPGGSALLIYDNTTTRWRVLFVS